MQQYLCRFSEEAIGSGCTGVVHIKRGNEHELLKAVAVVGPVTVAVDSRHTSFQVDRQAAKWMNLSPSFCLFSFLALFLN